MSRVAFVSDLHLFASRSSAYAHFDALIQTARQSDECVLGGDIFDFRWSRYPTPEATADAAIEWLDEFISSTRDCQVHFVLGNHDDHPLLHARLPELQAKHPRFAWNRFYYRQGNTLFLHGDVADGTMTAAALEQQRDEFRHGSRSQLQHRVYDMAVKAHLHRLAPPAVYPKKRVAKRILSYLQQIGHGPETGLEHVCFGHTHRPVDNYQIDGVTFHNCGAPIGAGSFRIVCRNIAPVATR
ncbi:metallophosphoesterase [Planctomicrobium piriforme]|uniref:UDP-2,3-diacylglucosamine hydrolase n=1 Tax=Planctomicrobium piriforme TaxID=1576369 RepID=A0A1I3RLS6_9PLAN|nr:metallophosphoesterase [Planctomicrobium piriforme]SFJ46261.1 UDP-2,3-diacylglucosamine hydrolase [Planctomicrobium piriforme]